MEKMEIIFVGFGALPIKKRCDIIEDSPGRLVLIEVGREDAKDLTITPEYFEIRDNKTIGKSLSDIKNNEAMPVYIEGGNNLIPESSENLQTGERKMIFCRINKNKCVLAKIPESIP